MAGHCQAEGAPACGARNRPSTASEDGGVVGCCGWSRSLRVRRRELTFVLAALTLILGAAQTAGIASNNVLSPPGQPAPALRAFSSPPYVGVHSPSAAIAADADAAKHSPLLRGGNKASGPAVLVKIDKEGKKVRTSTWSDALGSPVSEAEPPASLQTPPGLEDFAKAILKAAEAPSALSASGLDTELVSSADEDAAAAEVQATEQARSARSATLGLDIGWSSIPHPLKVERGGEDSHIISRLHGATLLGVFDGVGGWAELGVDPALYARRLGHLVETALAASPEILETEERPLMTLLTRAFNVLQEEELAGSCTASLALLTAEGKLHVLNIGDSGVHVMREGKCVFRTGEQQHYFNCPFQLGMGSDDVPTDADYYVLEDLEPNDVVVAATDGVWDNLYEADMLELIGPHLPGSNVAAGSALPAASAASDAVRSPEVVARAISEASHLHGKDEGYLSPFSMNAMRHGLSFNGGKLDDVTVVVSRVCDISPPPGGEGAEADKGSKDKRTAAAPARSGRFGWGANEPEAELLSPVSSADASNEGSNE